MSEDELAEIEERWNKASSGAWIWEVNPKYHTVSLRSRGGLVVMDFVRWGMGSAAPRFLDENHLLHRVDKLMEPIPGREHHSHWAQQVNHPDAMAIAAAPEDVRSLIAEVRRQRDENLAMQSRLDIAEGRVEGMREENERLEREFATYAEIKTDRNLELSERIQNLQSRIKKLQKQRDEFEKDIRI